MALVVTAQQAKVLVTFRRSTMATELYNIAVDLLNARREEYEETTPATEALRLGVVDAKHTLAVLFEDTIEIKE